MTATDHTGTVVGVTSDTEGVVRLAADDVAAAGLSADDPVVVRGDDETAATVAVDPDLAARSVVVDDSVADAADAGVGDTVTVTAVEPQTASRLRFAPVPDLSIRGGESAARRAVGRRRPDLRLVVQRRARRAGARDRGRTRRPGVHRR